MEKLSYSTELYLKNIMLKSGKKHEIMGNDLHGTAEHQHSKPYQQTVHCCNATQPFLNVSIYVWRDELGRAYYLYKLYEQINYIRPYKTETIGVSSAFLERVV